MAEAVTLVNMNKPLDLSKPDRITCHQCKNELEAKSFLRDMRLPGGRGKICFNCRQKNKKEADKKRKENNQFFEF